MNSLLPALIAGAMALDASPRTAPAARPRPLAPPQAVEDLVELNREIVAMVTLLHDSGDEPMVAERAWQTVMSRSARFLARLPAMRRRLGEDVAMIRAGLTARRQVITAELARARDAHARLTAVRRRMRLGAALSTTGRPGPISTERHRRSLLVTRGALAIRIDSLLRAARDLERERQRRLDLLDSILVDVDRAQRSLRASIDVLARELPGVQARIAASLPALRGDLVERLTIHGMTPSRLTRSLEEIHRRILAVLRLPASVPDSTTRSSTPRRSS